MKFSNWPFPITVQGDICNDQQVEISVRLKIELDSKRLQHAQLAGSWFGELAMLGAFPGKDQHPKDCKADVFNTGEPLFLPGLLIWNFKSIHIAPEGWVCFLNLMLESKLPILSIKITGAGDTGAPEYHPEDYPQRYADIPFDYDEQFESSNRQVIIRFKESASPKLQAALKEIIATWLVIGSLGGYRKALPLGELSYLICKDEPELVDKTMHFRFIDRNAHPGVYDGLINLLTCISSRYLPIEHVQFR